MNCTDCGAKRGRGRMKEGLCFTCFKVRAEEMVGLLMREGIVKEETGYIRYETGRAVRDFYVAVDHFPPHTLVLVVRRGQGLSLAAHNGARGLRMFSRPQISAKFDVTELVAVERQVVPGPLWAIHTSSKPIRFSANVQKLYADDGSPRELNLAKVKRW